MFIDVRKLDQGHVIDADICIIGAGAGAGAAGITIAREYANSATQVALIESGGMAYDEKIQSLYEGENVGMPSFDLNVNRLRYFGGTTNHWAGHCRPLDAIDFEKRSWTPHSGWPITRKQLDPYYERAQPIVGLGPYEYENLSFWQKKLALPQLELDENRLETVVYNQSPPTRFGPTYQKELQQAQNVAVYLNANVLEISTNETASQVTGLKLACIDGPELMVSAKIFILATGGMENARLLLLSDQTNSAGLGNENDLVGRFFMDHILLRPGVEISLSDPRLDISLYSSLHREYGSRMFAILASPEKLLRREKLNNFRMHLLRRPPRYKMPLGRSFAQLDGVSDDVQALDTLAVRQKNTDVASLHLVLEPTPNPDSRVSLSMDQDFFGQRKLAVNWQTVDHDLRNAYRALELAALEFGRMGLGRAYGDMFGGTGRWPNNLEAGRHHCGTTRMADDPKTGVVDQNCKVHSLSNLFIAGSSVFPTIGYANPTLSIVALALRLADHTRAMLAESAL